MHLALSSKFILSFPVKIDEQKNKTKQKHEALQYFKLLESLCNIHIYWEGNNSRTMQNIDSKTGIYVLRAQLETV